MASTKASLLYGMDKADNGGATEFITRLLDAVSAVHKVHLMTTGPGSFAAHEALGAAYEALDAGADSLAEAWMGCTKGTFQFAGIDTANYAAEVQKIYDYIEQNRLLIGTESHIQNEVDALLHQLATALFKLDRLA